MFFVLELKRQVVLKPHQMRPSPLHERKRVLMLQLEKDLKLIKGNEEHGYYITVTEVGEIGEGVIQARTGSVAYRVQFKCLVLKPHKGEVVVGEVSQVTKTGFEVRYGPFEIIFVHQKLMKGFQFKLTDTSAFNSFQDSQGSIILKGSIVRMRLVAVRWEAQTRNYMGLATLNGHYLGPIEGPEAEEC
ncbi:hypothetical protein O6H91_01G041500 [Diphasiastrum complanatum]|uniref:Uncharacterized protein n=1 Tax=Diphasiastrum complanatum TaxID=34168 RepID=A0ACC2EQ77_DIPCM|nr:hypothetical protein O6H91_01G041500 [Diphasiastrum complanatum]